MELTAFIPLLQACDTPVALVQVLEQHERELALALFAVEVSSPAGLQQVMPVCRALTSCPGFQHLDRTRQFPPAVVQAVTLFATTYVRANGFALAVPLRSRLPADSSVRLRLQAQGLFNDLTDLRTGYIGIFSRVMDLLLQAQFEGEADYTAYVVQVAYAFLQSGRDQLLQHGFLAERATFSALFSAAENLRAYSFLSHPALAALLAGEAAEGLLVRPLAPAQASAVLFPTALMQGIFRRLILDPVQHDRRTRGFAAPLGYASDAIRAQILEYGRADFTQTCYAVAPPASPADRVLLYCYYNLRKHFFTTRFVLSQIIESVPSLVPGATGLPVFLDLGCGPMTSALAFADLYRVQHGRALALHYVGIDIAEAMLAKAREFEGNGLFDPASRFDYFGSWESALNPLVEQCVQITNPVIINASYLFASTSLNVSELVLFTNELRRRCPAAKMYFLFQNPNRSDRNVKYYEWKRALHFIRVLAADTQQVNYQTNPLSAPSAEDVTYELLAFQPD